MTWWCSATGQQWSWAWRPYPGVWLFVALLVFLYYRASRRAPSLNSSLRSEQLRAGSEPPSRREVLSFSLGVATVWFALDWPIGPLGAGYLVSFHTVSYILLSLIAPPLLILGLPRAILVRAAQSPRLGPLLRTLARPLLALALFNAVLIGTHVPDVVDTLMRAQLGAFAVDLSWLLAGLTLWWPVTAPTPEVSRLSRPVKMGYLFAATVPPTLPAAFLTFADYPLYGVYELAPRVFDFSAHSDQQVAGLTMKLIGDLPLWLAFGVVFFRWARESAGSNPVHPSAAPTPHA